jgi:hypothetical protein
MKVIVAGCRYLTKYEYVEEAIETAPHLITELVSGKARGVDTLGEVWAKRNNVPIKSFPADWDKHGKAAGHIRNAQMGDYADALIAVWDGHSPGTRHMITYMHKLGKPVFVFNPFNKKET